MQNPNPQDNSWQQSLPPDAPQNQATTATYQQNPNQWQQPPYQQNWQPSYQSNGTQPPPGQSAPWGQTPPPYWYGPQPQQNWEGQQPPPYQQQVPQYSWRGTAPTMAPPSDVKQHKASIIRRLRA